jgi:hypothetical protein
VAVFRYILAYGLVAALLAGGMNYLFCSPAMCAASDEHAIAHCPCCGPNCPMKDGAGQQAAGQQAAGQQGAGQKDSRHSEKHNSTCDGQCPLSVSNSAVAITHVGPQLPLISAAMADLQPFQSGWTFALSRPIGTSPDLQPPTLLRLCCALTT